MLGLAETVGDDFCYKNLAEPTKKKQKPTVWVRSVVRCCYDNDAAPIVKFDSKNMKPFILKWLTKMKQFGLSLSLP